MTTGTLYIGVTQGNNGPVFFAGCSSLGDNQFGYTTIVEQTEDDTRALRYEAGSEVEQQAQAAGFHSMALELYLGR